LEDEIRQVKESLEAREKDLAHKDANLQRLVRDMSEVQTKVSRVEGGMGPVADMFCTTRPEACRVANSNRTRSKSIFSERTTGLNATQAFLTRADAVSEAGAMIESLNTLIGSASAAVSVAWDQREPVSGTLSEEPDVEGIRDHFGNSMVEQIAARNSVAITLAIQTCLCYFIEQVTSGWGGGQAAGTLAEIYTMISTKGKLGACA